MIEEYRLVNVLLAGLVAMLLWVRFNDRPSSVPRAGRMLRHSLVAVFALGAVGSLELYLKSASMTVTSVLLSLGYVSILGSLWFSRSR